MLPSNLVAEADVMCFVHLSCFTTVSLVAAFEAMFFCPPKTKLG